MNTTQDHTISRRKQKKTAKKLERAQLSSEPARKNANAAIRNSCARRLHNIMRRPGRGGLSAKGAEQLRRYLSKKVPESEKGSVHEMDPIASMMILQVVSEEIDARDASQGTSGQATEEIVMANGKGENGGQGGQGKGKGKEEMQAGQEREVEEEATEGREEEEPVEEGSEQGGVALAHNV